MNCLTTNDLVDRLKLADVNDDDLFESLINEALEEINIDLRDMAEKLGVSYPILLGWMSGTKKPHSAIRRSIYDLLVRVLGVDRSQT
jgi:8-oxo-dGTP pyrophosphatase MutT (NUDIX family)